MGEPDVLRLVTAGRRSGRPREVELWFARHDGCLYLIAETGERAHWVRNLRADPRVLVRLEGSAWPARARVVAAGVEPDLHGAVAALFEARYGWSDGLVVELRPEAR